MAIWETLLTLVDINTLVLQHGVLAVAWPALTVVAARRVDAQLLTLVTAHQTLVQI